VALPVDAGFAVKEQAPRVARSPGTADPSEVRQMATRTAVDPAGRSSARAILSGGFVSCGAASGVPALSVTGRA